ncbi:hypothetical protein B5G22_00335 [Limosilactobacillus reuteri]|uniref:Uncharacterized protein n=1 Tax=Limosilactobacillus reuteri TaxID=1598 RepID=A0A1Y3UVT5_LIMRT|nr:hypothetical protein [Limosilactobacillus reuteri]OUN50409.1 hypothetical protein B5G22_00335 [Limosilactobacillus reuteri]OUP90779.1 hypothetical protein B5F04_00055 [Limosilactobacillus reuteri]
MKNLFTKIKNVLDQESISINMGTGKSFNQYHSCGSSIVNMNGVRLEITPGMVRLYTDDEHYKIVVDGEVVRR